MLALLACGLLIVSEFYLRLSGAVMVGLPSTALGMVALMLLVVRRPTWPWLLAAAVIMALALQTKLLAAIIVPAAAVAIYVNTMDGDVQGLCANWQRRLGRVIAWGAMTGAAYLLLGLALGALHFDLLFGTHLGAMTANVQNFVEEASGFFPHFVEQHTAYLLLGAGGLVFAAYRRTASVLVPLAWLCECRPGVQRAAPAVVPPHPPAQRPADLAGGLWAGGNSLAAAVRLAAAAQRRRHRGRAAGQLPPRPASWRSSGSTPIRCPTGWHGR